MTIIQDKHIGQSNDAFFRTYKEVTEHDLRMPLISGVGRAKRLLGTIGVTRGLGDHNLVALSQLDDVPVKPFMSSVPEVRFILKLCDF